MYRCTHKQTNKSQVKTKSMKGASETMQFLIFTSVSNMTDVYKCNKDSDFNHKVVHCTQL